MGLFLDILTLPVLGGPKLVFCLARSLADRAMTEMLDEAPVRAELAEVQERYDAGEVEEEEYDLREKELLERLSSIRELKKALAEQQ